MKTTFKKVKKELNSWKHRFFYYFWVIIQSENILHNYYFQRKIKVWGVGKLLVPGEISSGLNI